MANSDGEADGQPRVAFGPLAAADSLPNDVVAYYSPTWSSWNDFGYRTHARVGVRVPGGRFEWISGRIAFKSEKDSSAFLDSILRNRTKRFTYLSGIKRSFATSISGLSGYQTFVSVLGLEAARTIAKTVNDVSLLAAEGGKVPGWPDFFTSDAYLFSFIRNGESAFAIDHGGAIFGGAPLDAVDSRSDFKAKVSLGGKTVEFEFRFPELKVSPKRITAIIGRNGVGKTKALSLMSKGLVQKKARGVTFDGLPSINRVLSFVHSRSKRAFGSRVLTGVSSSEMVFSLDPGLGRARAIELTSIIARLARNSTAVVDSLQSLVLVVEREFVGLKVLVPIVSSEEDIGGAAFLPLSDFLIGGEQRRLQSSALIDTKRPLRFVGVGGKAGDLSLGQEVFLVFVMRVFAHAGPASVLLIDEPENFLHPNLVSKFVRVLNSVLEESRSIAIVATHSPFLIRELAASQVHVLHRSEEAGSVVVAPRAQTFGASVALIANDIFQDDLVEHLYESAIRNSVNESESSLDALFESLSKELSLDAYLLLRELSKEKGGMT